MSLGTMAKLTHT